jgi:hypothetical protein
LFIDYLCLLSILLGEISSDVCRYVEDRVEQLRAMLVDRQTAAKQLQLERQRSRSWKDQVYQLQADREFSEAKAHLLQAALRVNRVRQRRSLSQQQLSDNDTLDNDNLDDNNINGGDNDDVLSISAAALDGLVDSSSLSFTPSRGTKRRRNERASHIGVGVATGRLSTISPSLSLRSSSSIRRASHVSIGHADIVSDDTDDDEKGRETKRERRSSISNNHINGARDYDTINNNNNNNIIGNSSTDSPLPSRPMTRRGRHSSPHRHDTSLTRSATLILPSSSPSSSSISSASALNTAPMLSLSSSDNHVALAAATAASSLTPSAEDQLSALLGSTPAATMAEISTGLPVVSSLLVSIPSLGLLVPSSMTPNNNAASTAATWTPSLLLSSLCFGVPPPISSAGAPLLTIHDRMFSINGGKPLPIGTPLAAAMLALAQNPPDRMF